MFKKILKWTGIVIGSLIVVLVIAYTGISMNINHRINKQYHFKAEAATLTTDTASIARGRHLVAIKGCNDCHGANMAGKVFLNDGALGVLSARNLTHGKGGLPKNFTTADWLMALDHGVDEHGKPLLFMPSYESAKMTQKDKLAIIAYCNTLPDVDNVLPAYNLGPVTKVMTFLGKMPLFPVDMIDHNAKQVATAVAPAQGAALGKYLSVSCTGCHRENFKGGDPIAPGFPPVPNITATGAPGKWSRDQFMATLRTGKTPEGKQMKPDNMPWKMTAQFTDKEIDGLYDFLTSLKN